MTIWDSIERTDITPDQFLSITLKPKSVIDEKQMSVQNANTSVVLGCIRDRYTANLLLYDTRNHITLRRFLQSVPFDAESFRQLLLQLMEGVDAFSKIKLAQTNIVFSLDHVYVDVVNKKLKFVYLPVHASIHSNDAMATLAAMLREMIQISAVADGHALFGIVLMHINVPRFDAAGFYRDISDYESVTRKRSYRSISRVMLAFLLTSVIIAAPVLGVPLYGLMTRSYQITQFIDLSTVAFEALLFLAGMIVACLVILPLRENRKYKRKADANIAKAPKPKKLSKKKQKEIMAQVTPAQQEIQNSSGDSVESPPSLTDKDADGQIQDSVEDKAD